MSTGVDAVLLFDGRRLVEQLLAFTRQTDREAALKALAEGIQANPLWYQLHGARLVTRAWPDPLVVVFGQFSPEQHARLADLAAQLNEVLAHHRYVDYPAAEQAAERLATALRLRFGQEALARFRYTAIPRGGWIVLGMLSYLLNLRPDQIGIPGESGLEGSASWVVVDDCALSGVRFQQFLQYWDVPAVIFCPLFAPRELCRAIERIEPRVEACINAEDLKDVAPQRFGEAYPQWLDERERQMGGDGYWSGIAEYIAFAWCEPETKYWNAEAGRFEAGWNILPPALCLKRRMLALSQRRRRNGRARGKASEVIERQAMGLGSLKIDDRVLWTSYDASLAVARFPTEGAERATCFQLDPTAADMWRALLTTGSLKGALSMLLDSYAVAPDILRRDLALLVADLEENGIMTHH
ncbi:PqqD family protein [Halomonas sp. A29]|uniref:PqqD family protein n=1 Tax=Halomonas sp. A29 TaxID=3102786 RepID=UPI00398B597F